MAGVADFQVSGKSRQDGFGCPARIVQSWRGDDSSGPVGARKKSGSRLETPPRKILPDRPHRTGRQRKGSSCVFRRTEPGVVLRICKLPTTKCSKTPRFSTDLHKALKMRDFNGDYALDTENRLRRSEERR